MKLFAFYEEFERYGEGGIIEKSFNLTKSVLAKAIADLDDDLDALYDIAIPGVPNELINAMAEEGTDVVFEVLEGKRKSASMRSEDGQFAFGTSAEKAALAYCRA